MLVLSDVEYNPCCSINDSTSRDGRGFGTSYLLPVLSHRAAAPNTYPAAPQSYGLCFFTLFLFFVSRLHSLCSINHQEVVVIIIIIFIVRVVQSAVL